MDATQFINKWRRVELTERSAAQQHFLDLCELVDHPKPAELDPTGETFTFERGASKHSGGEGWADVWKRGFFGWEYKGRRKNLNAAYDQLLLYRSDLENPPLLVVCDMDRIVVHTNFTAARHQVYDIPLRELDQPHNLEILRAVFHAPETLRPGTTSVAITQQAARHIAEVAQALRDRGCDPLEVAQFLDRIVFALFAEDIHLLPEMLFTRLVARGRSDPKVFGQLVGELFGKMATGGFFGVESIRYFNGSLFDSGHSLELTRPEVESIHRAALLDWGAVDPSIFGTLFERGLDPSKRSQLGAHYTSREDIETLIEPVVMQPLRREWKDTRETVRRILSTGSKTPDAPPKQLSPALLKKARGEAEVLLRQYLDRLARVKVLDPACGSGNFLYVTLQKLKDLEKEAIDFSMEQGLSGYLPMVGPWQLYGIEINPYAFDLAQMSVWIGYLQWTRSHGYPGAQEPVLRSLSENFRCMDAILDLSDPEHPKEPEWPKVDFIVGNPPFLGGKKMRTQLGDEYMERLFHTWRLRVPAEADLCCYWFEQARGRIEAGMCQRAGLLATQGIRGGANREVLKRIKASGDIFFAQSDRPWVLDGANVHVSMVGFDAGIETVRALDDRIVASINPNLSSAADISQARRLGSNLRLSYMGDTKGGAFDIPEELAVRMLSSPNPHGRANSDVIIPWTNGLDVTRRPRSMYVIDFGVTLDEATCSQYEMPFEHVRGRVQPEREKNNRESYRRNWWRHVEPRPALVAAISALPRFLCTARVAKHRLFIWEWAPTLPDCQLFAFARPDDYFLGILHSRLHETWALALGTRLETRPRYTPTTCFETFPFPHPSEPQEAEIAKVAAELDRLRSNWLNPPEWTREEVLEFPGSVDGPWSRYLHEPDRRGIGTVRYPRTVPRNPATAAFLAKRTLTNLYNAPPTWLRNAHRDLDEAVFAAYGWSPGLTDDELLARLLALNLERANSPKTQSSKLKQDEQDGAG